MIQLTPQEKDKIKLWLAQEAETAKGMLVQAEKIDILPMVHMLKRDIYACMIVTQLLSGEEHTL